MYPATYRRAFVSSDDIVVVVEAVGVLEVIKGNLSLKG